MPGAVPRTSTYALTNATLPFVMALAEKGWRRAMRDDSCLRDGLNIHDHQVTHPAVAQAFGLQHVPAARVLAEGDGVANSGAPR
jgi:alanine dehydrogenase